MKVMDPGPSLICKLKGTHHKQLSANTSHTHVWCEGISSIDGSGHDEKKCTTNHIVIIRCSGSVALDDCLVYLRMIYLTAQLCNNNCSVRGLSRC